MKYKIINPDILEKSKKDYYNHLIKKTNKEKVKTILKKNVLDND